ncbi:MAG: hypothetical protein AB8G96_09915 [Phycisphaerales bacterium]
MQRHRPSVSTFAGGLAVALTTGSHADFLVSFTDLDFRVNPVFNDVTAFRFELRMGGDLLPGRILTEADVLAVDYRVVGVLKDRTPSGLTGFTLLRTIDGQEFRDQGSSLFFTISADADPDDGLQLSELAGTDPNFGSTFLLNAREVDTGRYHPPILTLSARGEGRMENSNNFGGVNPVTGKKVDVDFGDEYTVDLATDPATLTLAVAIPPECPADVNESGFIDVFDLIGVLAAWGPCDACPQDIDASGAVDFLDVLQLLDAWGPCQ